MYCATAATKAPGHIQRRMAELEDVEMNERAGLLAAFPCFSPPCATLQHTLRSRGSTSVKRKAVRAFVGYLTDTGCYSCLEAAQRTKRRTLLYQADTR
ncbi:hypothetical protein HPB47_002795 [Ixodes persulcatus]|uniref:Uncharacterized protein n=1 Tax=Ixodes persulcatus TaxID=34615 RepID=A0AC60PLR3_IXOPE|nr:hypothetical protein HPB47_002795 [Ixodes persulcatus]